MAESDPNAEAVLARLETALARVAALAAQKFTAGPEAAPHDPSPASQAPAPQATAALAAGLDQVIARLHAALAETGG